MLRRMGPLAQRLQRRAIVVLAWLVLALSVAPPAVESVVLGARPFAVYAGAASSLFGGAAPPGLLGALGGGAGRAPLSRSGGPALASSVASSSVASAAVERSSAASAARTTRWVARANRAGSAVAHEPPPACLVGVRDERHLYLSICRLSC